jgi:hypothetical protein
VLVQPARPFSATLWSKVEALPKADARRLQDDRLREQLAYVARRSHFYRGKFTEDGADIDAVQGIRISKSSRSPRSRSCAAAWPPHRLSGCTSRQARTRSSRSRRPPEPRGVPPTWA